jgi:hypothetical protein
LASMAMYCLSACTTTRRGSGCPMTDKIIH